MYTCIYVRGHAGFITSTVSPEPLGEMFGSGRDLRPEIPMASGFRVLVLGIAGLMGAPCAQTGSSGVHWKLLGPIWGLFGPLGHVGVFGAGGVSLTGGSYQPYL